MLKIEQLPATPRSPKTLLYQVLEEVENIESLAVVIGWKEPDATTQAVCSEANNSDLVFMERILHRSIDELMDARDAEESDDAE